MIIIQIHYIITAGYIPFGGQQGRQNWSSHGRDFCCTEMHRDVDFGLEMVAGWSSLPSGNQTWQWLTRKSTINGGFNDFNGKITDFYGPFFQQAMFDYRRVFFPHLPDVWCFSFKPIQVVMIVSDGEVAWSVRFIRFPWGNPRPMLPNFFRLLPIVRKDFPTQFHLGIRIDADRSDFSWFHVQLRTVVWRHSLLLP